MGGDFPIWATLLGIVSDGAYASITGLMLATYWLRQQKDVRTHPADPLLLLRRLLIAAATLLVLAHAARPWALASGMSGLSGWSKVTPLVPQVLNGTHVGALWYWEAAAILFLFAGSVLTARRSRSAESWVILASLVVIGFVKAASGHAGGEGDFTFQEIVQTFHILATAVWAGAILISGFVVLPSLIRNFDHEYVEDYGKRLSGAATAAVIVVLASGVFTGDRELDNKLSGLWRSSWGQVLSAKVFFVLIALSLGAYSRFYSIDSMKTKEEAQSFMRTTALEAGAMVIILCLSGLLGSLAPDTTPN